MGIEIVRLGSFIPNAEDNIEVDDLTKLSFNFYSVDSVPMHMWYMSTNPGKRLFPWWAYKSVGDKDIQTLQEMWNVTSAQSLFDLLFLSFIWRSAGSKFFAIFPGNIKSENWVGVRELDRTTFLRGQGCIYHLYGENEKKLSINWVPYWQPQSLVKDPSVSNFWNLFSSIPNSDPAKCITFFHLSDTAKLPQVVNLLIQQEENRSEKLAALVDWFGFYSSPNVENLTPASVVYSKDKEVISQFVEKQKNLEDMFQQIQSQLVRETHPHAAIRLLSRLIAL